MLFCVLFLSTIFCNITRYYYCVPKSDSICYCVETGFLRCFRDLIRLPRIENRVPRIREIGCLQLHTGYLTFSLKKLVEITGFRMHSIKPWVFCLSHVADGHFSRRRLCDVLFE